MNTGPYQFPSSLAVALWIAMIAPCWGEPQVASRTTICPYPAKPDPRLYDLVRVLGPGEAVLGWPPLASGGGINVANLSPVDSFAKIKLYAEYYGAVGRWELRARAIVVEDRAVGQIDCDDTYGDVDIYLGSRTEVRFVSLPDLQLSHASMYVDGNALFSIPEYDVGGHHIWIKDTRITTPAPVHLEGVFTYGENFLVDGGPGIAVQTGRIVVPPLDSPPAPIGCPLEFVLGPGQSGNLWDMVDPITTDLINGAIFRNASIDPFAGLRVCYTPSAIQQPGSSGLQMTATGFELSDNYTGEVSILGQIADGDAWPTIAHGRGMKVAIDYRPHPDPRAAPPQPLRSGNLYTLGVGNASCLWELPDGTRFGNWSSWPDVPGTLDHSSQIIFDVR